MRLACYDLRRRNLDTQVKAGSQIKGQCAMKRAIFEISLKNKFKNEFVRQKADVIDAIHKISRLH